MQTYQLHDLEVDPSNAVTATPILEGQQLGVKLINIQPGQVIPPHHTEAEAFFLVLKGAGTITVGDNEVSVVPGQLVPAPPATDHALENSGQEPLTVLLVQTPNPFFCC